jgi:hypothetical protein
MVTSEEKQQVAEEIFKHAIHNHEGNLVLGHTVDSYPEPGRYVVTGMQSHNLPGEGADWLGYIGYVVQVRLKGGAFGTHLVILRHHDESLSSHGNQCFYYVDTEWEERIKDLFNEGVSPENEDYSEAFTIAGEYPEFGKLIQPKEENPPADESPKMKITVEKGDGSKEVHVV